MITTDQSGRLVDGGRAIVLSRGLSKVKTLGALLSDRTLVFGAPRGVRESDTVVCWGMRPNALAARAYAERHGLSIMCVEDGLSRSVGLASDDLPLSLMIDDLRLYLDASGPTRLERTIARPQSAAQTKRAHSLCAFWRESLVSKYNYQRDAATTDVPFVLVVDQPLGDAPASAGMATKDSFDRMLDAALADNPCHEVVVKVHPEVIRGRKQGHYDLASIRRIPCVRILSDDCHPALLLKQADSIHVVSSQLGFKALMWGKVVNKFGMPFYASWGLTKDDLFSLLRRAPVSLDQLVHASLVEYPRYVDPETGAPCEPEKVVAWLSLQRQARNRYPDHLHAFKFSRWKRPFVRDFFGGTNVTFTSRKDFPKRHGGIIVWGRKHDEILGNRCLKRDGSYIRLKDGFLRAIGWGADFNRPISWVQNAIGICYDATRASGLVRLLATRNFDDQLLYRARLIIDRIIASGLTKYNVASSKPWTRPDGASCVVLVPGQVESNASLRYGASKIRSNLELLKTVRAALPEAFLIYKPHPDVVAKLRNAGDDEKLAIQFCELVLPSDGMDAFLDSVDRVHTITSLTRFEALLRRKIVVTYGQPFYAGWGLTRDMGMTEDTLARRGRKLTLEQLVACALVRYSTYVSRITRRFATPERAINELICWRSESLKVSIMHRCIGLLLKNNTPRG